MLSEHIWRVQNEKQKQKQKVRRNFQKMETVGSYLRHRPEGRSSENLESRFTESATSPGQKHLQGPRWCQPGPCSWLCYCSAATPSALTIQASSTKQHRLGILQRPEMYWPKLILESGYPRTVCQFSPVVVRACFWSHTAEFSRIITGQERDQFISTPFIRALFPFVRPPSSHPNHFPKGLSPNIVTLGL